MHNRDVANCANKRTCRRSDDAAVFEPIPWTDEIVQDFGHEAEICRSLFSAAEIVAMKEADFADKKRWFQDQCSALETDWWTNGHVDVKVRRDNFFQDFADKVLGLDRLALRKVWSCGFQDECLPTDSEEWFGLIFAELCNSERGLVQINKNSNRPTLQINPWSAILSSEDHLALFRFMGRIIGKALFDGQHTNIHFVLYLYKFISGEPITFADVKSFDIHYYDFLQRLEEHEDISTLRLNFTVAERIPFVRNTQHVELFPGGKSIQVTENNLSVYEKALARYVLFGRIRPQLTELLLGFYEVVPRALLSVFDSCELEVLMCGSAR